MSKQKLTVKQQRFADEFIKSGNSAEAARIAGYSLKTAASIGNENLNKPYIKAYIDKRLDELKKESIAEQDEILQFLTSVMRGTEEDEQLLVVGAGEGFAEVERHKRKIDTAQRIKAAEQLARVHGMFRDKLELDANQKVMIIDDISSEFDEDDFEEDSHDDYEES